MGGLLAFWLGLRPRDGIVLVAIAVVIGVGIDLDHFIVSRFQTGDWRALNRCLTNPTIVLLDQAKIFEDGDLTALQRLLSHQLLGGVIVVVGWILWPSLGMTVLAVLYVHILADLFQDVRQERAASSHNR
ncbi:MAG: hypothetical protein SVG88_07800 [Halobacteriales archaeon]|nr:hypothetical protein [Halobacteriales archaeon]